VELAITVARMCRVLTSQTFLYCTSYPERLTFLCRSEFGWRLMPIDDEIQNKVGIAKHLKGRLEIPLEAEPSNDSICGLETDQNSVCKTLVFQTPS
jgi:hypothetical protein